MRLRYVLLAILVCGCAAAEPPTDSEDHMIKRFISISDAQSRLITAQSAAIAEYSATLHDMRNEGDSERAFQRHKTYLVSDLNAIFEAVKDVKVEASKP